MAENSNFKTILIIGGVAVVGYLLFKDKIKAYFEGVGERFNNSVDTAANELIDTDVIPGLKPVVYTYNYISGENYAGIPRLQAAQNVAVSIREGTKAQVKAAGGNSYNAYSGTLKVKDLGYSVSAQNAPAMTQQIIKATNTANLKTSTATYGAVSNPYAQFRK